VKPNFLSRKLSVHKGENCTFEIKEID